MRNNTISQCTGIYGGGMYSTNMNEIQIFDNKCQKNSGLVGGCLSIYSTLKLSIQNSNFTENSTPSGWGGAVMINYSEITDPTEVTLTKCNFTKNIANVGAGVQFTATKKVTLTDLNFESNTGNMGGALIFFINTGPTILDNINCENNNAPIIGSCYYLYLMINFQVKNSKFISNQGTGSGPIYLTGASNFVTFDNNLFYNNTSLDKGGSMYILGGSNINIINQNFDQNQAKYGGNLYISSAANTTFTDNIFQNGNAFQHGAIFIEKSQNINFKKNNTLIQNTSIDKSSAISIFSSNLVQLNNLTIKNNYSQLSYGGMDLENLIDLILENIIIDSNTAVESVAGVGIINSNNISFNNIEITNNICEKQVGGILFKNSFNSTIKNTKILNNQANNNIGGGMFIDFSENFNFQDNQIQNNTAVTAGGIYINGSKNITLQKTQIKDNISKVNGAAIFCIESNQIIIENSKINNNIANNLGGAIFIQQTFDFLINNSQIYKNSAKIGAGLYIIDRSFKININNSQFFENIANTIGGAIYTNEIQDINFKNCQFQQNYAQLQGASLFLENLINLNIESSYFSQHNNNTQTGSCIYGNLVQNIIINQNNFENNTALQQGASLYLDNSQEINISNNNFVNNSIQNMQNGQEEQEEFLQNQISQGGAISVQNSKKLIFQNNFLSNNFANLYGGAVFILDIEDILLNNNTYYNNKVFYNQNLPLYQKGQNYLITQGGSIYIETKIYQKSQITIKNEEFSNSQASSGAGIFINNNFNKTIDIHFENIQFINNIADFGPGIRIIGTVEEINQNFITKDSLNIGKIQKDILFQGYYKNEKLINTKSAQFELCIIGQNLKSGGQIECEQCDPNAQCEGGYIPIYPLPEYWRETIESQEFIYCNNNPLSCKGNDTCAEGYTGLLCEQCDILNNYSQRGQECFKCASSTDVWMNLSLLFMVSFFILVNQIYGVNSRVKQRLIQKTIGKLFNLCFLKLSQISGITKIFLMHFQIFYIIAAINIDFPYGLQTSIQIFGNPQKIFSTNLQCLVEVNDENDVRQLGYYLAYYGLACTIATLVLALIFQILLYCFKKLINNQLQCYVYCSFLSFFLMIQPGMLQNSLQFLSCRDIGNNSYNSSDSNILCTSDFYKNEVFPINLTFVLLLGLIIPIILGLILFKKNKNKKLNNIPVQRSFGILYMEVKQKYFYWEIISMITKISVVVLSILYEEEKTIKGCLQCLIIVFYLLLCLRLQPYTTKQLNQLSITASTAQIMTIILVLSIDNLNTEESSYHKVIEQLSLIIISAVNILFLVFTLLLINKDFERILRSKYMLYFQNREGKVKDYLMKKINKQFKAKLRWRKIILAVKHSFKELKIINEKNYNTKYYQIPYKKIIYSNIQKIFHNQVLTLDFNQSLNLQNQINIQDIQVKIQKPILKNSKKCNTNSSNNDNQQTFQVNSEETNTDQNQKQENKRKTTFASSTKYEGNGPIRNKMFSIDIPSATPKQSQVSYNSNLAVQSTINPSPRKKKYQKNTKTNTNNSNYNSNSNIKSLISPVLSHNSNQNVPQLHQNINLSQTSFDLQSFNQIQTPQNKIIQQQQKIFSYSQASGDKCEEIEFDNNFYDKKN